MLISVLISLLSAVHSEKVTCINDSQAEICNVLKEEGDDVEKVKDKRFNLFSALSPKPIGS